jgi:hypothetical protein
MRFTSNPPVHRCEFESVQNQELTQTSIERWATLPIQQRAQAEIASLVALVDAPLEIVEDDIFQRLLNALVDIGRENRQFRFGGDQCPLTRYRTRKAMIDESIQLRDRVVRQFAKRPCVSLAIDAGTIEKRHFLDIMILAPYSSLDPFLYDVLENETLTSDDYGNLIAAIIKELKSKGVRVRSIVGDNLPAQVSALAHWSKNSRLRGVDPDLNGIKYSPCMCHFMQLVIGDLIANVDTIREFEAILQSLIDIVNSSEVYPILRIRCPQCVKTRWLSRSDVLSWLLSRQDVLLNIDFLRIQKARRSKFQGLLTEENFQKLSVYHKVLHPCVQAVRFFEQDHITLCHVYPAIKILKRHLEQQEDPMNADINECLDHWHSIAHFIRLRQRKLLDMDLVKLAFWLTSFGCTQLAQQQELIPESHQLRLQYEAPRRIVVRGPLDAMATETSAERTPDIKEDHLADCAYAGDSITEDALETISRFQVRKGETLTFIRELLVRFLCEDSPSHEPVGDDTSDSNDIENSIRSQVDNLITLFFCGDEYVSKSQETQAGIEKQVELWNYLARNTPGRPYDQVVDKIISIISIPASEASCERSFSRQKRIMGHSRVTSNGDLLRARFLLKGGPRE